MWPSQLLLMFLAKRRSVFKSSVARGCGGHSSKEASVCASRCRQLHHEATAYLVAFEIVWINDIEESCLG